VTVPELFAVKVDPLNVALVVVPTKLHVPPTGVALKVIVSSLQTDVAAVVEYTGNAFTVTVVVAVAPPLLYVTTTLPELEPVKTPVEEILPLPVPLVVVHVPPDGVAVKVILPFSQTSLTVEVIDGPVVTVKVAVSVHPLLLVNVMSVVPTETGVTTPEASIVATEVALEFHPFVPNAVPVADKLTDEPPAVAVKVPEIDGLALTVTA
jgi:hypothetical protein